MHVRARAAAEICLKMSQVLIPEGSGAERSDNQREFYSHIYGKPQERVYHIPNTHNNLMTGWGGGVGVRVGPM